MTEPQTEAGRRLLGVAYLAGDAESEGVNLRDAILAIEREAQGIPLIDVIRVRTAVREAVREWGFVVVIPESMPDGSPPPMDALSFIADAVWSRLASESSPVEEGADDR